MAQIRVIHLEMDGEHFYFGSPKAMFDIMGRERMGMSYASFHSNIHLKIGVPYYNRRNGYTIRMGILGQAKTNRNSRKNMVVQPAPEVLASPIEETVATNNTPVITPEAKPVSTPETGKRKKKDKEIPEQLTLF